MSIRPTLRSITRFRISQNYSKHATRANVQSQTFQLPDGRVLGFAEYGIPNGKPLLFFHGYPSSRLEAEPADDIARRCGIRLLSLDRPGFGLSTPQPGRRIVDWPHDVHAFATGMGLNRFVIMGGSGGGPFALACAHVLPRHMVAGVGLFASAGPWEAGAHHMSLVRRLISTLAVHSPSTLGVLFSVFLRGMRAIATSGPVVRRIDAWLEALDKKEKEKEKQKNGGAVAVEESTLAEKPTKTTEERRNDLLRLLIDEPFAQGVDAAVLEARLLSSQEWGFKFEDVDFDPVRIWHGAKDVNSPIAVIRYLAQRLPHGVLREYENDTHYTMFPHVEEAMNELARDYDSHSSKVTQST